jgi:hypothetical protein
MSAHIEGQGNCASTVSSGNTPPNLNSINQTFNIPYKTFFELEGTATDTDNDPITYCWEQWDLGSFDSWNTVSNVNPLFRSFYPTSDNVRMFPELVKIRPEQIKTKGEVLPEVDRNLSFKLAARDIRNGYGSFNYSNDELEIQAINTGNSLFRVTSHSTTGTNWTGDTKQTVTWDPAGTQNAPISASTVDIYFSVDTGRTWPWLMASNVPNNGSYDIYAPNVATNYGLYKVKGHGNIFFDINNGYINVIPQTYPLSLSNIELDKIEIFPNPASYSLHVRNLPNNALSLQLSSTNGQILAEFEPSESLDLGNISNGMYFLKIINTKKESIIKKLIIQH